jgi:hypothetical protein
MNAHRPASFAGLLARFAGLLALLGCATAHAQFTTLTWNASVSDNWNASIWWDPQIVPSLATHKAQIAGGTVTMSDAARSIGALSLSAGTLAGTQTLTITDTGSTWTGGTMSGTGSTNIALGANLSISGSGHNLGGRTIDNSGTVFHNSSAPVVLMGAGTIANFGLWDMQGNTAFSGGGYTFQNTSDGILKKSSLAGLLSFSPVLANSGSTYVEGGTLSLDGGGSSTGVFEVFDGAILQFNSNYTLNAGTGFIGTGTVQVSSGTLTLGTGFTLNPHIFTLFGGTVTGDGTWEVPAGGTGNWFGGILTGAGNTVIKGDLVISSGGGNPTLSGRNLINQGYIYFAPQDHLTLSGNVQITNSTGAVFEIGADRTFQLNPGTQLFVNQTGATLLKTETNGTFTFTVPMQNAGNVIVSSGTLAFTSTFNHTGGSLAVQNGASLQFSSGLTLSSGVLTGAGTIGGNVTSSAVIAPGQSPGVLNINGDLTLLATSVLIFELGGTNPGVNYDTLNVAGTATLNGSLLITFTNSFQNTVTSADTFTLIGATTLLGTFTNPAGSPPRVNTTDGFGSFEVSYSGTNVALSNFVAIPEPSTWALLITGGLALALQLRRRFLR